MSNGPETPRKPASERMPELAEQFVQACKGAGIALDYLPRTLPLVDKQLNFARAEVKELGEKKDPRAAAIYRQHAMWIAAYLGEVIRRETSGIWFESEQLPLVDVGLAHHGNPLELVQALFEHGRATVDDNVIQSTKAYCELIVRLQRQWIDGAVLGTYPSMTALRTSMTTDAKTAGLLVGLASVAVLTAKVKWDAALDFTPESLDPVEQILGTLHGFQANAPPGQGATEEQIATNSTMWGVYVGEVIRRFYGGVWSLGADGVMELAVGNATSYPIGKVRKRIVDGPADNIRFYFTAMARILNS